MIFFFSTPFQSLILPTCITINVPTKEKNASPCLKNSD
uniref:Uncharacterized protein n=1 Tax=Vitis vinifera TaxID=29760 RepID=F6H573_VITVI